MTGPGAGLGSCWSLPWGASVGSSGVADERALALCTWTLCQHGHQCCPSWRLRHHRRNTHGSGVVWSGWEKLSKKCVERHGEHFGPTPQWNFLCRWYRLPVFLEIILSGWCLLDGADPKRAESGSVTATLCLAIFAFLFYYFFQGWAHSCG